MRRADYEKRMSEPVTTGDRGFVIDARDPTSHNLWPFEILMWGGACVAFMVTLKFARRLLRAA